MTIVALDGDAVPGTVDAGVVLLLVAASGPLQAAKQRRVPATIRARGRRVLTAATSAGARVASRRRAGVALV
jgi:hypothetical protein